MSLPVAILAGGFATRLLPITEKIPKALVDVAGKPFILRQLEHLHVQGLDRVVICVNYLGGQIEAALGDGKALGMEIKYSWDGENPLGTAGALKKASRLLGDTFFVYYGDSFLPIDFQAVAAAFASCGHPALMTVLKNEDRWDKSNVIFVNGKLISYDKKNQVPEMKYIDYGLGIISASILKEVSEDKSTDLSDIYRELSRDGRLAGFEVFDRFYEIGSHKGLDETTRYFTNTGLQ